MANYQDALVNEFDPTKRGPMQTSMQDPRFQNLSSGGLYSPGQEAPKEAPAPELPAPAAPKYDGSAYTGFERHGDSKLSNAFDLGREQNPRKSAKDAFAYAANQAAQGGNAAPLQTMEGMEKWLRETIAPSMESYGTHKILDVKGDKMLVQAPDGTGWVNVGGRTGAADADLYWGAEGMGGGQGQPQGQGGMRSALGGLNSLLQGNPHTAIQGAMDQQTEQSDYLKALLAQLGVQ